MSFMSKALLFVKYYRKVLVLIGGPLVFLPLVFSEHKAINCMYVLCLVALFWITEVLELAVTSLIPIVLFPAFGILTPSEVAASYMKEITVMIIGGIIVAKVIEKQNLHTRLALRILICMGPNPIFQYLGFMLSTWFLSMWISNTATTAMMVTLGMAVVHQWELIIRRKATINEENHFSIEDSLQLENPIAKGDQIKADIFSKGLFLSIAYSASCGGIATLTGTGPNLIFYGFIEERYGSRMGLNFGSYMSFALPVSVTCLFITWVQICLRYVGFKKIFKRKRNKEKDNEKMGILRKEYASLGPISYGEISALVSFSLLVLLWILREPGIPILGRIFMRKNKFGKEVKYWSDSTSAILVSFLVFILPARNPFRGSNYKGSIQKLLDWKNVEKEFPWGVVLLFGAGFALADGCLKSGLSDVIGENLTKLRSLPEFAIIFFVTLGISFLTEVTSNGATATILIPIMLKMAECIEMHPMKIGLASVIAASFAFCLPADIFGTSPKHFVRDSAYSREYVLFQADIPNQRVSKMDTRKLQQSLS